MWIDIFFRMARRMFEIGGNQTKEKSDLCSSYKWWKNFGRRIIDDERNFVSQEERNLHFAIHRTRAGESTNDICFP